MKIRHMDTIHLLKWEKKVNCTEILFHEITGKELIPSSKQTKYIVIRFALQRKKKKYIG